MILSKGPYTYAQPSGFLTVKQYIFTSMGGKRCLVLRFSNDADYKMDTVELTLTQMDAYGNVLATTPARLGIFLAAGKTAAIDRGIPVEERCVDFKVHIDSVRSGDYVYRECGGHIVVEHDVDPVWHMDPADRQAYDKPSFSDFEVSSKQGRVPALVGLTAALCALALTVTAVVGYLPDNEKEDPKVETEVTDVNP
jgi:hypothetical protein